MRNTLYIAIDDTDELGYPKSTGMFASDIASYIESKFPPYLFISCQQLLLDDIINYTSHNGSLCFTTNLDKDNLKEFTEYAKFLN